MVSCLDEIQGGLWENEAVINKAGHLQSHNFGQRLKRPESLASLKSEKLLILSFCRLAFALRNNIFQAADWLWLTKLTAPLTLPNP